MGDEKMNYEYPFDSDWSTEEIIDVISFSTIIEKAYENGINKDELMQGYSSF